MVKSERQGDRGIDVDMSRDMSQAVECSAMSGPCSPKSTYLGPICFLHHVWRHRPARPRRGR